VHVGLEGPETALRAFNHIRSRIPLLVALGANSPFWRGRDSGLAAIRVVIFDAFPRTGPPRAFGAYEDSAWSGRPPRTPRRGPTRSPRS